MEMLVSTLHNFVMWVLVPIGVVYFGCITGTFITFFLYFLFEPILKFPIIGFLIEVILFYLFWNKIVVSILQDLPTMPFLASFGMIFIGRMIYNFFWNSNPTSNLKNE